MLEDLIKIKDRVEFILQRKESARDSDKILWLAYLNTFHHLKTLLPEGSYEIFKFILLDEDTPTMESIRRIRQKFQEDGFYIGKLRTERMEEKTQVRRWAREQKGII